MWRCIPDLVLASTSINRPKRRTRCEAGNAGLYTSDPHTVRGMLDSTAKSGGLAGREEHGAKMVADLQKRLDALHAALQDRPMVHVLFVVWEDPLISIGQNTFIADALRWAGAESVIVADQNWPQVSMEEVVRLQPEYIVLTPDHMEAETDKQREQSARRARVARTASGESGARGDRQRRSRRGLRRAWWTPSSSWRMICIRKFSRRKSRKIEK